jgi:cell division protein DivIC
MKNRKLEKSLFFLFCGLFVAAGVFFSVLFGQTYREYTNIKSLEAYYEQRLAEMEAELKEKEEMLYLLRHDPSFIERTIRQLLGYAKPGELVFRFEEPEEAPQGPPSSLHEF